ncbi:MAG: multidrug effflux MFS transporter [Hyphomicrobiaceae bacterium]
MTSATGSEPKPLAFPEFVALMALLMALTALSIDIMLPALPDIARRFALHDANAPQLIVPFYLFGLAAGQVFWGPLSDRRGRRPPLLAGLAIFAGGALLASFAPSFWLLLAARVVQGFGAGAARTISIAIVRDAYAGRDMARVMSLVISTFIIVPVIAPTIGQGLILAGDWSWPFHALAIVGVAAIAWVGVRLPETAGPSAGRAPVALGDALRGVLSTPVTVAYALAVGLVFGSLVGYVASAQQIFVDVYGLGPLFPIAFGAVAVSMAISSLANAALVRRFGMRRLSHTALVAYAGSGGLLLGFALLGTPPLWLTLVLLSFNFFMFGLITPNLNAIAMHPQARFAGMAASLIGGATTVIGSIAGLVIARQFDGSVRPLALGFLLLGVLAFAIIAVVEGKRGLFRGE